MVILDKPFVSEFLQTTLEKNRYPVVDNRFSDGLVPPQNLNLISEEEAIRMMRHDHDLLVYTNSENSIAWIEKNLPFSGLPEKIRLFKNKVSFRETLRKMYPAYFFKRVPFEELDTLNVCDFPFPFIIKPAVGFFSMGVYKVDRCDEWPGVLKSMGEEVRNHREIYPKEVIDTAEFIVEEVIHGDEFAIDCYFDRHGEPVILNIMQHVFASGKDVSDRLYFTSKKIMHENLQRMHDFLSEMNEHTKVKNFPGHVEVRVTPQGDVVPIEVNPMRFGGWCSSPDMAWYAFGINEYEYFFNRRKPDWEAILSGKGDSVHAIVVLDNTTGIDGKEIAAFEYEKLLAQFKRPLDIRKADYKTYPLFGMLFCETGDIRSPEMQRILKSDLREFARSRKTKN